MTGHGFWNSVDLSNPCVYEVGIFVTLQHKHWYPNLEMKVSSRQRVKREICKMMAWADGSSLNEALLKVRGGWPDMGGLSLKTGEAADDPQESRESCLRKESLATASLPKWLTHLGKGSEAWNVGIAARESQLDRLHCLSCPWHCNSAWSSVVPGTTQAYNEWSTSDWKRSALNDISASCFPSTSW